MAERYTPVGPGDRAGGDPGVALSVEDGPGRGA